MDPLMMNWPLKAADTLWICDEQKTPFPARSLTSSLEQVSPRSLKQNLNRHERIDVHMAVCEKVESIQNNNRLPRLAFTNSPLVIA